MKIPLTKGGKKAKRQRSRSLQGVVVTGSEGRTDNTLPLRDYPRSAVFRRNMDGDSENSLLNVGGAVLAATGRPYHPGRIAARSASHTFIGREATGRIKEFA